MYLSYLHTQFQADLMKNKVKLVRLVRQVIDMSQVRSDFSVIVIPVKLFFFSNKRTCPERSNGAFENEIECCLHREICD